MKKNQPTQDEMIQAVRNHAAILYQDGWHNVVEYWVDLDIIEAIGNSKTCTGAIKRVESVIKANDRCAAETRIADL